jgi:hypothetical protein
MYKLYCYGDRGDYDGYYEIESEHLADLVKHIEENSWYRNYREEYKTTRTNFVPIRITEYHERTTIDQNDPHFDEILAFGKVKAEQKWAEEDAARKTKHQAEELKQLAGLKKKYESGSI